jgi:hypothetical protein
LVQTRTAETGFSRKEKIQAAAEVFGSFHANAVGLHAGTESGRTHGARSATGGFNPSEMGHAHIDGTVQLDIALREGGAGKGTEHGQGE